MHILVKYRHLYIHTVSWIFRVYRIPSLPSTWTQCSWGFNLGSQRMMRYIVLRDTEFMLQKLLWSLCHPCCKVKWPLEMLLAKENFQEPHKFLQLGWMKSLPDSSKQFSTHWVHRNNELNFEGFWSETKQPSFSKVFWSAPKHAWVFG